jgi:hypothetical protein
MFRLFKRYPLLYVATVWLLAALCTADVVRLWHTAHPFSLFLRCTSALILAGLGILDLYGWWRRRADTVRGN